MRRIGVLAIVATLLVSAAPVTAGGPELSYYMTRDDCRQTRAGGCTPKSQPAVSVGYSIIYQLEDGSYIGADNGDWDGPTSTGPSIADISVTTGNAIVGEDVGRSWGERLRDSIRKAVKGTSKLVPKHQVGRAAMVLANPGARFVTGVAAAI